MPDAHVTNLQIDSDNSRARECPNSPLASQYRRRRQCEIPRNPRMVSRKFDLATYKHTLNYRSTWQPLTIHKNDQDRLEKKITFLGYNRNKK